MNSTLWPQQSLKRGGCSSSVRKMSGWWRRDIGKWSRKAGSATDLPPPRPQPGRPKPCRPCGPPVNWRRTPNSNGFLPPEVVHEDIGPGIPLISPIASRLHPNRIRTLDSQSAGSSVCRTKTICHQSSTCPVHSPWPPSTLLPRRCNSGQIFLPSSRGQGSLVTQPRPHLLQVRFFDISASRRRLPCECWA